MITNKTYSPKKADINPKWYILDLENKTLGKAAAKIASYLRGKHKPEFSAHMDCGDYVIVVNAEKVKVTGNKMDQKIYYSHSGYPGALKQTTLKEVMIKNPKKAIERAVSGMIPHNRLKKTVLSKLKVFIGREHPHQGQKPLELNV